MRNKRIADIASDHHLLVSGIRLRIARIHRKEEKIGSRFNTRRLEDGAVKRITVLQIIPKVEAKKINAFIATGELHTQRKQWITDGTWKKIEK